MFKINDLVSRKSHGNDVVFKIVKIEKHAKTPSNKEKIVIEKTSSKE